MKHDINYPLEIKRYCFMIIACILYAFAFQCFLVPSSIVAGGVSGLSIVIRQFLNIGNGIIMLIVNVPLILFSLKSLGLKFTINCLITTVVLSATIEIFAYVPPLQKDKLMNAVFGGVIQGVGIGLFCKYKVSSGGTELAGRFIHNMIKGLSIPVCTAICDSIIVVTGAIVLREVSNVFYALIVIFISSRVSDMILVGINQSKLCYIISDDADKIGEILLNHSPRGITKINAMGMYTKKDRGILMTVVKANQVQELKEYVMVLDPKAFVIVSSTYEVLGNGFKNIDKDDEEKIKKNLETVISNKKKETQN